ncbi:MAG: hypothetical protein GEU83_01780 [Pseudonocardiaceae bacterium]|nr:hypothetical protein [Pseudonocardiaceae bacterium]
MKIDLVRRPLVTIFVVAAMSLVSSGAVAQAQPTSTVRCGDVITENTVLAHDVGPCPDNGIIMGSDRIRLDLNGHRVFGTPDHGDGAGVLLYQRTGVQVTGGTVSDFDAGVAIEGGSGNRITNITARDNIGHTGASDDQQDAQFGDGIAILSSTDNLVSRSQVIHNGPFSGIGLFQEVDEDHPREVAGPTTGNRIQYNVVSDNDVCRVPPGDPDFPRGLCDNDGIRLEPGVHDNVVSNNTVTGSALDGIALFFQAADNVVTNNAVSDNGFHGASHRKGDGIRVFLEADRTRINANEVFDNAAYGIIVGSLDNRILGNKTGGNEISDLFDQNEGCDGNQWRGNTFDTASPDCTIG